MVVGGSVVVRIVVVVGGLVVVRIVVVVGALVVVRIVVVVGALVVVRSVVVVGALVVVRIVVGALVVVRIVVVVGALVVIGALVVVVVLVEEIITSGDKVNLFTLLDPISLTRSNSVNESSELFSSLVSWPLWNILTSFLKLLAVDDENGVDLLSTLSKFLTVTGFQFLFCRSELLFI